MITFKNVLEMVTQLPREQQEMLVEIVKKRTIDARRQEILEECQEALAEYQTGNLKPMSATEEIAELCSYLEDNDE